MKTILILLTIILISINQIYAQTEESESLKEFNSGQVSKYSSFGQDKSQGLKINIKYPKSWKSMEGERPHVVRKFAQQDNYVLALIIVNKQDNNFSQSEISEILTPDGLKSIIPPSGIYISSNPNLKIEGLKAGSVEYTNSAVRMDRMFYSCNLNYIFYYGQYIVTIQFMVVNKMGESNLSVENRYKIIKPLFYQMFNSIVIDNVWEK
jgi:hypothetical protein